jgi:hypothetical protein
MFSPEPERFFFTLKKINFIFWLGHEKLVIFFQILPNFLSKSAESDFYLYIFLNLSGQDNLFLENLATENKKANIAAPFSSSPTPTI